MRALILKIFPRIFYRLFYLGSPPWDSGITPPELDEFIKKHPAGRAIDLGCGTGTNAITLARHGWQVRGVDFVPKAIRQGNRKARREGVAVDLRVGDVTNPVFFEGAYDLILDIGCYHSLSEALRTAYQRNVKCHLARGGTFLIYTHTGEEGENFRFTPKDLTAFEDFLRLERRDDSDDVTGRTAAWLWFKND